MLAWNAAIRKLSRVGLVLVSCVGVACTTTQVPEADRNHIPEEYTKEENAHTYGVIEDDLERYEWTSRQYEDPRFASELDNSPTAPEPDYKPVLAAERSEPTYRPAGQAPRSSSVKMTKASKSKGGAASRSTKAGAKAGQKRSR